MMNLKSFSAYDWSKFNALPLRSLTSHVRNLCPFASVQRRAFDRMWRKKEECDENGGTNWILWERIMMIHTTQVLKQIAKTHVYILVLPSYCVWPLRGATLQSRFSSVETTARDLFRVCFICVRYRVPPRTIIHDSFLKHYYNFTLPILAKRIYWWFFLTFFLEFNVVFEFIWSSSLYYLPVRRRSSTPHGRDL